jgi:hypothetical protein
MLVLPDPDVQPLSVRLPTLARSTELDVLLAALTISALIAMVLFPGVPVDVPAQRGPQRRAQGLAVIIARRTRSARKGRSGAVRGDQRKKRRDRSGRRRALRLSHRSLQERQGSPSGAHIGAAATMWPQTAE